LIPAGRQQELEAALSAAINGRMRNRPLVRRVGLSARTLCLEVAENDVGRLLADVLPVVKSTGVSGIPGLRPVPGRNHLDLRLVGVSGSVRLAGVHRGLWRAAVGHLVDECGADAALWSDCRDHLDDAERRVAPNSLTTDLLSAVLRRQALLRSADQLFVMSSEDSVLISWKGGLEESAVAAVLVESVCRIPGVLATPLRTLGPQRGVLLSRTDIDHPRDHPEPEWAWNEVAEHERRRVSNRQVSMDCSVHSVEKISFVADRPDGQWNTGFDDPRKSYDQGVGCSP